MPATKKYKILVFRVGAGPEVAEVANPWNFCKELIDGGLIQIVHLDDGVQVLSDEEGGFKDLPVNRIIPAHAPKVDMEFWSFIIKTDPSLANPGEAGFHAIRGNFILANHDDRKDTPLSLTDDEVRKYSTLLGGQPPCPTCGGKPAVAGDVYCAGSTCKNRRR